MHPLVSWRSKTARLFVSFIIFVGLVGLGMAFGGFEMNEQTTMKRLGLFSGIWTLISTISAIGSGTNLIRDILGQTSSMIHFCCWIRFIEINEVKS